MKSSTSFVEIAARHSKSIPSRLAVQLSKIKNIDDLRGFLDDVAAAEASAEILVDTELHSAAIRRLERLGFGPADYQLSKKIMLGVIFSDEVSEWLEADIEREYATDRLLAA
ncbi:MAG TPA: hypothetical protein VKT78_08150 [Fimbriimonadaceae bacterium]|nr:hypothetical protein [Fimbriimonadaceae bacterium]